MITEEEVTYTKIIKVWHCDFCSYTNHNNKGCCGVRPVMTCYVCDKHVCHKHRNWYSEDNGSDYADAIICPTCNIKFEPAWSWALDYAGRNENIVEATIKRMDQIYETNNIIY